MAACVTRRLGPHLAKSAAAIRCFHCSTVDQAGGKWRVRQGLPVNSSQFGPLTDLPDWSFADGRPAPPMKGYLSRQEKNAELARRVAMISAEMDHGIEKWEAQQREQERQAQEKRCNRLQPKGNFFPETAK
ncbi:39S ribosomal protein L52, mitochondrial [Sceloporus undulatus]|uniref:39S ribosomal protein L52, mitochondrial n=1 Tax=Sceloporus undulatus TaxID=8520 RepID=UPI001C4A8914|nr:39S ribosomal protein L52, mitochondrial [Sceloporus undulatus]